MICGRKKKEEKRDAKASGSAKTSGDRGERRTPVKDIESERRGAHRLRLMTAKELTELHLVLSLDSMTGVEVFTGDASLIFYGYQRTMRKRTMGLLTFVTTSP